MARAYLGTTTDSSPETVKDVTGKYLSPRSGYIQTCLTAGVLDQTSVRQRISDAQCQIHC